MAMRLLETSTFSFGDFMPDDVPEYAILSHTWGHDEVLYGDILESKAASRLGWTKIERCCRRARADGFSYVWIDTCCINKTNSVELSTAINSMFAWYEQAAVCYAYLDDVGLLSRFFDQPSLDDLHASRWFKRGWTLQELLAPKFVLFLDANWNELGTRSSLAHIIESITQIDRQDLVDFKLCSIATKMTWASGRTTTLVEDEAYCMLGLFGVHMSLIYGEGRHALVRLQQELIKMTDDESVLAWNAYASNGRLLAASASAFHTEVTFQGFDLGRPEFFFTNKGLIISPLLYQKHIGEAPLQQTYLMPLNCGKPDGTFVVALTLRSVGNNTFQRVGCGKSVWFPADALDGFSFWKPVGRRKICIEHRAHDSWLSLDCRTYLFDFRHAPDICLHSIQALRAGKGDSLPQPAAIEDSSPAAPSLCGHPKALVQMSFGNFVCAEVTVASTLGPITFTIAIRRCDKALTIECWADTISELDFHGIVRMIKTTKPSPADRTDTAEAIHPSGLTLRAQLRPRGWPRSRRKHKPDARAADARAFNVSIVTLGPGGSVAQLPFPDDADQKQIASSMLELRGEFKG